mmetsp:Transcript_53882/g.109627  ORF Transcript_53882/g.109627 Transcript_53882/m.109627 type:complete len:87 (-) Transcript_53882:107-367(-)
MKCLELQMKNAAKAKAVRSGLMYFKKPKLDAIRPVFMMIVTTCSKSPLKMASAFLSDVAICLCQAKFTGVAWLVALSSVAQLRLEI